MAKALFVLLLLGCLALVGTAQSPGELLLRRGISSAGASTVTLTENVALTADLPVLGSEKALTVIGKPKSGKGKVYIDGKNLFSMFTSFNGATYNRPVSLTLKNLIIKGNPSRSPGAVYLGGEGSKILVSGVDFLLSNRAIFLFFVEGTIDKSTFSSHSQGAIELTSSEGFGKLLISGCTFKSNVRSLVGGGAIYGRKYELITIKRCTFASNKATAGGAIYLENTDALIQSSKFSKNEARGRGGAIFDIDTSATVSSSTFEGNKATGPGGVISINADGINPTVKFISSKFSKNVAVTAFGGVFELNAASYISFCSVSRSTFQGNTGNRIPNNGFVVGVGNRIFTFPNTTIPNVVLAPDATVAYSVQRCN